MTLKRTKAPAGRLLELEHDSRVLAGNPWGDPTKRKLHVWLPAQYDRGASRGRGRRFPVLFDLVGYTGSGMSHTAWRSFEENVPELAARLVHQRKMGPVILVFPVPDWSATVWLHGMAFELPGVESPADLVRARERRAREERARQAAAARPSR